MDREGGRQNVNLRSAVIQTEKVGDIGGACVNGRNVKEAKGGRLE